MPAPRRASSGRWPGGRESGFGPRGVHGSLEELLFPMLHGTSWYAGLAPLPPFAVYGADRLGPDGFTREAARLRRRVRELPCTEPLPYRAEQGGDYDAELVLRPEVAPDRTGLLAHREEPGAGRDCT